MSDVISAPVMALKNPWQAGIIFGLTFFFISFRRIRILPIGRPSFALFGAVLMVVSGVMTPQEAYSLVNWDTICLLLGMMIIAEHLREAGLFERFTGRIGKLGSPGFLLVSVSISSAILSAILVNDTICVVMTPLVLEICLARNLNPFPYLMALATSSNIGSALTLTGNPQNMIIGSLSKLSFSRFILMMAVPVACAFLVNLLLLWFFYRNRLVGKSSNVSPSTENDTANPEPGKGDLRIGLLSLGVAVAGFFSGYSMAFSALLGAVVVILLHRKDPGLILSRLEWSLLLFFAALFVVIGGLRVSGIADLGTNWAMGFIGGSKADQVWGFSWVTLVGSNIFSNVPFVLIAAHGIDHLVPRELFWNLLAFVSTIAGNLTLFGSVANLIVAESSKGVCEIGFREYAKFGIPSTLLTLGIGCLILFFLPF